MKRFPVAVVLVALAFTSAFTPSVALASDAERLHDLFAREWEFRLESSPRFATSVGRHEYNHLLGSAALEDLEKRAVKTRGFLSELAAIDRAKLERVDQINYDIFRRQLEMRVKSFEFGSYEMPLNADSGFHSGLARLAKNVPLFDVEDYENYIARLEGFPDYFAGHVANMKRGMERGFMQPAVILQGLDESIAPHVVESVEDSAFWVPFASFPVGVPESDRERLAAAGRKAISESVVSAYRDFLDFMRDVYIPGGRESLGAYDLPDGREYYQHQIRYFTTLDLTPEEIHQIGQDEVARIRAEMEEIVAEVEWEGSFDEFLTFLRTDPRFYVETGEELLKEASYIAKKMDGKLPALFKTMPRLPYTVEPVPDSIAPKYTAGRYVGAAKGSTRPGAYWVNTYNLPSRPLYALTALSLHEAVPGHHFQVALNNELEGLPEFRRFSYISAFGEGWGLYSEYLGVEAGMYEDPYSNFGRLTYEMWRACRLVVDTGLHAFGWSRDRARDFLAANTALSLHEITTETDRYISWPGQALAYKLGELKIKELRRKAEAALGEAFDVREFHDVVLLDGSVPLPVLEDAIDRYIEASLP